MKVFISQPMNGLTEKEIKKTRKRVLDKLKQVTDEEIEVVNPITRKDAPEDSGRLWYLGRAISDMDKADLVVFAAGSYYAARGCRVEREVVGIYEVEWRYEEAIDLLIRKGEKLDI